MPTKPGEFPRHVRALIDLRAGGNCEVMLDGICQHTATDIHHRRPRGKGGSHDPETVGASNGLAICRPCHDTIERRRAWAYSHGFLIRHPMPPSVIPIWWRTRTKQRPVYVFLTDLGTIEPIADA